MLRIGDFSKLTKTTIKTLRYYDKIGLLKPAFVDSATAYRYYAEEQLETMGAILSYKSAGLPNEEIAKILRGAEAVAVLTAQRKKLAEAASEIEKQIGEIDRMLSDTAKQEYTAALKTVDACIVYCCRGYIPTVAHIRSFIKACD